MATLFARHPEWDHAQILNLLLMLAGALLAWLLWPGIST